MLSKVRSASVSGWIDSHLLYTASNVIILRVLRECLHPKIAVPPPGADSQGRLDL